MNSREKDEVVIWAEKEIHGLRCEVADLRTRVEDLLAAHRATAADLWEKIRQLEAKLAGKGVRR